MPRRPRFQPPWVLASLTAAFTASFMVAAGSLLLAALPLAAAPDPSLPPPETFRNLQLITLACGRENTAERCGEARRQADPGAAGDGELHR